ncbi:transketolase [Acidobacteria bacterium AH-259-D05]|nr:transketolase [Acidobacteria bacterium AH-259-D05]
MSTRAVINEKATQAESRYADLEEKARWVRNKVLDMALISNSGHVSTAFSQTELLVALYYGSILRYDPKNPKWDGRDRFILSKGQGGIGLYPILADVGYFPLETLDHFAQKDNILGVHSEWNIPGIEVITGSLGHGFPMAVGMAQAAKNDNKDFLVVCLLGDSELFEGSNWEAATFAGSQRYRNLVCMVDRNKQGVLGFTDEIVTPRDGPHLEPLDDKFRAFGFEVRRIDGHSFEAIFDAFKDIRTRKCDKPLMIIADTKKGKGISFIEDTRLWHYRVPKGEELERSRQELMSSSARRDQGNEETDTLAENEPEHR